MAGEDVVEVDGTSGQETDPLRLGELWESQGVEERRFRCLEVSGYILEYRLRGGERRWEVQRAGLVTRDPWEVPDADLASG